MRLLLTILTSDEAGTHFWMLQTANSQITWELLVPVMRLDSLIEISPTGAISKKKSALILVQVMPAKISQKILNDGQWKQTLTSDHEMTKNTSCTSVTNGIHIKWCWEKFTGHIFHKAATQKIKCYQIWLDQCYLIKLPTPDVGCPVATAKGQATTRIIPNLLDSQKSVSSLLVTRASGLVKVTDASVNRFIHSSDWYSIFSSNCFRSNAQ